MFKKKRKKKFGTSNIRTYQHPSRQQHKKNFLLSSTKQKKTTRREKNKNIYIKKKRNWLIILAPICTIIVLVSMYFLLTSSLFTVEKIIVSNDGFEIIDHPIKNLSTELLQTNIIFSGTENLKKNILENFPEIEKVNIIKKYPHEIQIDFIEYEKALNVIQYTDQETRKYIVNKKGLITDINTENSYLPYISLQDSNEYQLKDYIFTEDQIEYFVNSITLFEEKFDIKVNELIYIPIAREVHLETVKDFSVWLDIQKDLETQYSKLERALPELDIYNEPLEYIDLRIFSPNGDKIVFKKR